MSMKQSFAFRARARQAGFTLVEMMIALTVGLFLCLGFTVAFVNMKGAFVGQGNMTQLQDNERLAMTILTASVQEAGFFPNPLTDTAQTTTLLAPINDSTYGNMAQGQAIMGTDAASGNPVTLSTRYAAGTSDSLLNCVGGNVSSASASGFVRNVFYVDPTTNSLGCIYTTDGSTWNKDSGKPFALISNVTAMSVLYGVDSDSDGNIDKYLTAGSVTSGALWPSVKAARITLTFINPNDSTKPISWTQTINLMNNK